MTRIIFYFSYCINPKFFTSNISVGDASTKGIKGYMPNSGIVFPQTEAKGLLKAAAMCIMPVSCVITASACFSKYADSKQNLPKTNVYKPINT